MQDMISNTRNPAVSAGVRRCAALALGLALVACKPAAPEAGAAAEPAAAPPVATEPAAAAPAPTEAPAAAAPQKTAVPAEQTDDDDEMGPGLDDSYNIADLRPEYGACIDASDAVMPAMQACQDEELAFQQGRLRAALARISTGPDGYFKDEVMNWQAEYMRHTNANCSDEEEQRPVGESQSCFINRYANRASALEALADMAQRSNDHKQ